MWEKWNTYGGWTIHLSNPYSEEWAYSVAEKLEPLGWKITIEVGARYLAGGICVNWEKAV